MNLLNTLHRLHARGPAAAAAGMAISNDMGVHSNGAPPGAAGS